MPSKKDQDEERANRLDVLMERHRAEAAQVRTERRRPTPAKAPLRNSKAGTPKRKKA